MIFTFYSYKGGVGRSMALANVAEWFRRRGLKVVMVDWDLEAPGLESFFLQDPADLEKVRSQIGIMDMLCAYRRMFTGVNVAAAASGTEPGAHSTHLEFLRTSLPGIEAFLYEIDGGCDDQNESEKEGGLWLLTAGKREGGGFEAYGKQVQEFDWADFYNTYGGKWYFEWLREQLNQFADVVLVDSRTGLTEMGGVCARQLADVVVSFVAPNFQNLAGVKAMVDSFTDDRVIRERDRALDSVVVPARLDGRSDTDLQNEFERRFRSMLPEQPDVFNQLGRSFWDLKIPYISKYAYKEKLAVGQADRSEDLEKAYSELALHLATLAPEGSPLRIQLTSELQARFPKLVPSIYVLCSHPNAAKLAQEVEQRLHSEGHGLRHSSSGASQADFAWVLNHTKHLIVALTPEALASPALRPQIRSARARGLAIHYVMPDTLTASALPGWMHDPKIHFFPKESESLSSALKQAPRALRIPFMVPDVPPGYVRRSTECKAMIEELPEGSSKCFSLVLAGPAGVGKSTLAADFCHDEAVTSFFRGGVVWMNLRSGADQLVQELRRVWDALTGEQPPFITEADAVARVVDAISARDCLLVCDDLEDEGQLELLLKPGKGFHRIVTTRNRRISAALGGKIISLGSLSAEQSTQLLLGPFGSAQGVPLANALAGRLNGNPLLLRLAAHQLNHRISSGRDVGAALASLENDIAKGGVSRLNLPGVGSIDQIAAESLNRLSAHNQDLCRRLALLEEQQINASELRNKLGITAQDSEQFMREGRVLSLLQFEPETNAVTLHFALREYLRSLQPKQGDPSELKPGWPRDPGKAAEEVEQRGKDVLRGQALPLNDLLKLVAQLKKVRRFYLARKILDKWAAKDEVRANPDLKFRLEFTHQRSLCTYKDVDLPPDSRLDRALKILEEADPLAISTNQETLGQAGAIYKRKWENTGSEEHLETSLAYYLRGHKQGVARDFGYTAINAAFVLDLLAKNVDSSTLAAGTQSELAERRRHEATAIRQEIIRVLPDLVKLPENQYLKHQWWFLVTVGEAHFGLRNYPEAAQWLRQAARLPDVPDWEWEATSRQLAALLRYCRKLADPADLENGEKTLREFLGRNFAAVTSILQGKIGLALSGGGFRASLYHIGVLARLAEVDLLRHIEYLSCVSGGSIIGAHYYLEVRHLLQSKTDSEITRDDYIAIVQRVARDFLRGVQTNIRTRVVAEWLTNLKMIFLPDYTRTSRAGALYESEIYSRIQDGEGRERWLNNLFIRPKGDENLIPKDNNWRRSNKVPIIVLNATTLNTGHNWQFTASFMGEPPAGADEEIDANYRLRRAYYKDLPPGKQQIRLGQAVAASACVPGLFDPLSLSGIYGDKEKEIIVRLVDGGVHDNQGIAALLEQGCSVMLVSDASGQMDAQDNPSSGILGVPLRANSILSARIRSAQYEELDARRRSGLLRGLMFVHLKESLGAKTVDWLECQEPSDPARQDPLLPYGIQRDVQRRLAAIRTDLDSFSDTEAFALMTSGYCMTEKALQKDCLGFALPPAPRQNWEFLKVEPFMKEPGQDTELMRRLKVSDQLAFKVWMLPGKLRNTAYALGAILIAAAFIFGYLFWNQPITEITIGNPVVQGAAKSFSITWGGVLLGIGSILLSIIGGGFLLKVLNPRKAGETILMGIVVGTIGWMVARVHLVIFDKLYLQKGKIDRLLRRRSET